MDRPLIVITNDDGIDSPGLMAATQALIPLGELLIVAPHRQQTGAGRSFRPLTDPKIYRREIKFGNHLITGYSIDGTPAQVVAVALIDLLSRPADLVVSGINFGANIGNGITISGTVGAALEAASAGIPAMAVSLDTPIEYHNTHSDEIDFNTAGYFTHFIAQQILAGPPLPFDVDVIKVDVPASATSETPWRLTQVSRHRYHHQLPSPPEERGKIVHTGYEIRLDKSGLEPESDIWAVLVDGVVSISPVSLNLTSRVDLKTLGAQLYGQSD